MKKLLTNRPTNSSLTYFYTSDIEQVRKFLSEMDLLANARLNTKVSKKQTYVSFSQRLTDEQLEYIKDNFVLTEAKKNDKIITGFKGCLVNKFEFF